MIKPFIKILTYHIYFNRKNILFHIFKHNYNKCLLVIIIIINVHILKKYKREKKNHIILNFSVRCTGYRLVRCKILSFIHLWSILLASNKCLEKNKIFGPPTFKTNSILVLMKGFSCLDIPIGDRNFVLGRKFS